MTAVCQHAYQMDTTLMDEKWAGTEETERLCYVSEVRQRPLPAKRSSRSLPFQLCYIHSKLMIVDDRRVICGSANLNDRSQLGDHDSEIAVLIEDQDMVESMMDGKKYMASRLATTWRRQLMRGEHGSPTLCCLHQTFPSFQTVFHLVAILNPESTVADLSLSRRAPRPSTSPSCIRQEHSTHSRHAPGPHSHRLRLWHRRG